MLPYIAAFAIDHDPEKRFLGNYTFDEDPIESSVIYDRFMSSGFMYRTQIDAAENALQKEILEFAKLPDNWDFMGAKAIDPQIIENAQQVISNLAPSLLCQHTPHIYATSFGTISMDWEFGEDNIVSLEIAKNAVAYFVEHDGRIFQREDNTTIEAAIPQLNQSVGMFL